MFKHSTQISLAGRPSEVVDRDLDLNQLEIRINQLVIMGLKNMPSINSNMGQCLVADYIRSESEAPSPVKAGSPCALSS